MYSIYFDNKVINFTQLSDLSQVNQYTVGQDERIDVTKVLQKVENSKAITLVSSDVERLFNDFCSFFRIAEAAGGLVRRGDERALMIYRNGRWDLPKGHRERGESIEECAAREVSEECGITDMSVGKLICLTMHIYKLNEEWVLKKSYWYSMRYHGTQIMKPQTEEGIERVEWLDYEQVAEALKNSYKTIAEVFKQEKTII